jgi:hypothetical protein
MHGRLLRDQASQAILLFGLVLLPIARPVTSAPSCLVLCNAQHTRLRLRGGGDAVRPLATLEKVASKVDTLTTEEAKPDLTLKRHASRLVLNPGNETNVTTGPTKQKVAFKIDGKEVGSCFACVHACAPQRLAGGAGKMC